MAAGFRYNNSVVMLGETTEAESCRRWLQVVLILPVDGSANTSLSVVICHFIKNTYLEELLETCILYFSLLSLF
jgi:hypothetical protein